MRVLIAPDKFKGTLTARQAAEAMGVGVRRAAAERGVAVEIDLCPLADGGEGTLDVLAEAMNAEYRTTRVTGPLGEPVVARWAVVTGSHGSKTAIIESAQACGLMLVPPEKRDPARMTTRGVGELLRAAETEGCNRIYVGVGGSASVDAGIGMASALGWLFFDASGTVIADPRGFDVGRIESFNVGRGLPAVVCVLCDVVNPLLGQNGAARIYGPQKGATPEQVEELERGLTHIADVLAPSCDFADPQHEMSGAAGGLGYAMARFVNADLTLGSLSVQGFTEFEQRLTRCDVVITGEGRLDMQSTWFKVVGGVARAAARRQLPVVVVAGSLGAPTAELEQAFARIHHPLAAVASLVGPNEVPPGPEESAALLAERTAQTVGPWLVRDTRDGVS